MAKKTPKLLAKLRLTELSLVDVPANPGAHVAIFKRHESNAGDIIKYVGSLVKAANKEGSKTFQEILDEEEERRQQWKASEALYPMCSALESSLRSIVSDASVKDKPKKIQESVGQFLTAVKERLPDVEEELEKALKDPALAGLLTQATKETPMPDITKTVAELEAQVTELTKKLDEANAAGEVSKGDKTKLETEIADLKKKLEEAEKKVDVAKGDESLTIDGETIKKSEVGDNVFKAMKAQQTQIEKSRKETELVTLEKKADSEFGSLPGDAKTKAAALYALSKMDETERKTIEEMLKGGNKALADLMKSKGVTPSGNGDDPESQLEALVTKRAEEKKISKAAAYDEVISSGPGVELYNRLHHPAA